MSCKLQPSDPFGCAVIPFHIGKPPEKGIFFVERLDSIFSQKKYKWKTSALRMAVVQYDVWRFISNLKDLMFRVEWVSVESPSLFWNDPRLGTQNIPGIGLDPA